MRSNLSHHHRALFIPAFPEEGQAQASGVTGGKHHIILVVEASRATDWRTLKGTVGTSRKSQDHLQANAPPPSVHVSLNYLPQGHLP